MISSAGPSASEIIFTERRIAAGPLGIGGSSGDCARPKLALSAAASSANEKIWQPVRGKTSSLGKRRYICNHITEAVSGEVAKVQGGAGVRTLDFNAKRRKNRLQGTSLGSEVKVLELKSGAV